MNYTTNIKQNIDYTGYFNGKPVIVEEGCDVWLARKDLSPKTTREFVESEEFQMLERVGIEVHGYKEGE